MSTKQRKRPSTKLYQQDIVQVIGKPRSYGIVLRCWHDAEDVQPPPQPGLPPDPLMRPLEYGEVGVSFILNSGEREIMPASQLRLVDRSLQPGDFCKRSIDDVRSAVVTKVNVRARLEHAISGEPVEGWLTLDNIEERQDAEIGDYIIYDDWIGQVIEVFDESIVEVNNGHLVRLPELGSRLNVGDKGFDILPPPASGMQNLYGFLLGNQAETNATVLAMKHSVYAIAWLALNQSLDPADAEKRHRPQHFWSGEDVGKLTLIRGKSDMEMRVGDRVRLKKTAGLPSTTHGLEGEAAGIINVQMFLVTETETMLEVLWQDGEKENVKAVDVIPHLNPDEYDCWPGDHVVWRNEGEKRSAIVQSVNSKDRTASILFSDTGTVELVSVLELDPHGTSDPSGVVPLLASEGLGVRRGDFVLIHREGTTNGFEKPRVPRIGELEAWVRDPAYNEATFTGWRKEMADIGADIASHRSSGGYIEKPIKRVSRGDNSLPWIGEVADLNLDGTVVVTHVDWTTKFYPLERLTRLYDGIEQLEDDLWDEEGSEGQGSYADDDPAWTKGEDGVWRPEALEGDGEDWEDFDDDDEVDDNEVDRMDVDEPGWDVEPLPLEHVTNSVNNTSSSPVPAPLHSHMAPSMATPPVESRPPSDLATEATSSGDEEELGWQRFEILSEAPPDHAFYSSPLAQPSKSFLGRLTKEYRILASSLPPSIVVRAYEDRTDLLRCLIIGPENTPYQDAPFVIDWMLDSNFPNSPPVAHFLSWTNGNGRVNPNLYEEGKVCLSILGTWAGDRNEIWSATRSSLLQAFVSIQGLVLVKEPWFCEPAYEKLRGTEDGTVNSRLYSEKAYVLSRGFVRRALEIPLGGLENEINWFYFNNGRLDKVLQDAYQLVEKSRVNPEVTKEDQDLAVPRLTAGGIITLERTLSKLQALRDSKSVSAFTH